MLSASAWARGGRGIKADLCLSGARWPTQARLFVHFRPASSSLLDKAGLPQRYVSCIPYRVAPVPSPVSPALLAACTGHSSSRLSAVSVVSRRRDCCTGWFPPDVLPTIRPLARALNAHSSPARRLHPPTSSWVDLLPGSLDLTAHAPCHTALFTCTWCTPGPVTVISRNRPGLLRRSYLYHELAVLLSRAVRFSRAVAVYGACSLCFFCVDTNVTAHWLERRVEKNVRNGPHLKRLYLYSPTNTAS
ncbi:hypothetical protein B0H14DRAFT_523002 [Mycena olivaceomarginata]|nr:hypothetical protein B0H14DRAFT_523002 [Mycena olivaceomarginata]